MVDIFAVFDYEYEMDEHVVLAYLMEFLFESKAVDTLVRCCLVVTLQFHLCRCRHSCIDWDLVGLGLSV